MIKSGIVRDIAHLETEWQEADSSKQHSLFQTYGWNRAWCEAFSPEDVRIITLRDEEKLLAIIPLYCTTMFGIPVVRLIADTVSDYGDIVICAEHPELEKAVRKALSEVFRMKVAVLKNVRQDSVLATYTSGRYAMQPFSSTVCADMTPDYLSRNCKKKQMANALRLRKKLAADFPGVTLSLARHDTNNLNEMIRHKQAVLKKKSTDSIIDDVRYSLFLEKVVLYSRFLVFLSEVKDGDQLVAASFDFLRDGVYYYYFPCYNEQYYTYSPSSILLYSIIEHLQSAGSVKSIDFLKGDEQYKSIWATEHYVIPLCIMTNLPKWLVSVTVSVAKKQRRLLGYLRKR